MFRVSKKIFLDDIQGKFQQLAQGSGKEHNVYFNENGISPGTYDSIIKDRLKQSILCTK